MNYSRFFLKFSVTMLILCSLNCQFVWCRGALDLSPGIVTNKKMIFKKLFIEDSRIGTVDDIKPGELEPSAGVVTVVVGSYYRERHGGALILDKFNNLISFIPFDERPKTDNVKILDVDNDGICEFFSGGSGVTLGVVALFSHTGKLLWSYDADRIGATTAGSFTSREGKKFVVGFPAAGGIRLLDHEGKLIWEAEDSNVWQVAFADTNGDGQNKIVHSNASGQMIIRDNQGKILSKSKPEGYFSEFSICKWPTLYDKDYAITARKEWIYLLNFKGQTVKKLYVPGVEPVNHIVATPMQIKRDGSPYFAVLIDISNLIWGERSILLLYDRNWDIVYQEILPERCRSIAVLPSDRQGQESLLVGGKGKVWQYKAAGK